MGSLSPAGHQTSSLTIHGLAALGQRVGDVSFTYTVPGKTIVVNESFYCGALVEHVEASQMEVANCHTALAAILHHRQALTQLLFT